MRCAPRTAAVPRTRRTRRTRFFIARRLPMRVGMIHSGRANDHPILPPYRVPDNLPVDRTCRPGKNAAVATMDEAEARRQVIEAGKRLADRFFVASNDGNISARLGDGTFLVTPSSVNKGSMSSDDLLKVDADGRVLAGTRKPTSE